MKKIIILAIFSINAIAMADQIGRQISQRVVLEVTPNAPNTYLVRNPADEAIVSEAERFCQSRFAPKRVRTDREIKVFSISKSNYGSYLVDADVVCEVYD